MRPYLSFFRIRFTAGLQYGAAAWASISTQFAWGGMTLLLYRAFYEADAAAFPMPFSSLASYIWLQQALLALFMSWYFDDEILGSVVSGGVVYELCRPCDLYAMWFVKNVAVRLSRAVLRCAPILVFAAFLPAPYFQRKQASYQTGSFSLPALLRPFSRFPPAAGSFPGFRAAALWLSLLSGSLLPGMSSHRSSASRQWPALHLLPCSEEPPPSGQRPESCPGAAAGTGKSLHTHRWLRPCIHR